MPRGAFGPYLQNFHKICAGVSRAGIAENFCPTLCQPPFLMTSNHNNKNHYNNCSGDKQSNSQTLISLTAIPHKEAHHQ